MLKKIIALGIAVIIALPFGFQKNITAESAENFPRGDINEDGVISGLDYACYKRTFLFDRQPSNIADINYSTTFSIRDVNIIQQAVTRQFSLTSKNALLINEVCPSNVNIMIDENSLYSDWVELFNNTGEDIDLAGYFLSDSLKKPTKYSFPEGTIIKNGEYKVVFVSDETTAFAFSKDGESVVLSTPEGEIVDSITFVAIDDDIVYGRYKDASDLWKWLSPTPGKSNDTGVIVNNYSATPVPEFSNETGFYDNSFNLELSATNTNDRIYYTTDTTTPTTDSAKYTSTISVVNRNNDQMKYANNKDMAYGNDLHTPDNSNVAKGTVVRAFAFDFDEGNYSKDTAKTYFVGINQATKYNDVPVISVVTDADNLFGYDNGIFVLGKSFDDWAKTHNAATADSWTIPGNYSQRGREWEREVQFDFIDTGNVLGFTQNIGVRVTGNASRTYQQKSMKFYARGDYGAKNVKYDLLPGLTANGDGTTPITKFNSFVLRNGANDADYAKLRDPFVQELVENRSFDTQDSRPVVVFINGEYWGLYSLIQDYDDKYIENHYGVPADEVIIIESGREVDNGVATDINFYTTLVNYAKNNDLSNVANYATISGMMDINNFIEYCCAEVFIANADWMNNQNNQRAWRSRTIDATNPWMDGKWRWMMYDTEYSLGLYDSAETATNFDSLKFALQNSPLLSALWKNPTFKQKFITAMTDMINNELSATNSTDLLTKMVGEYSPLIYDNTMRWGPAWVLQWSTPAQHFNEEIDKIRSFLNNRKNAITTMLNNN
ncbi:hypothetical protein FACS1894132_07250 [Clostridia bacterium]|nr:hypothetical protein FACS1894132_07250 [Clostridia bacterium]